jgi:hypothetical protein
MALPAALQGPGRIALWLDGVLSKPVRIAIVATSLLLLVSFVLPMWRIEMYATQFPDGLEMAIYPQRIAGGNGGQDLSEINTLNHYIGMRPIQAADFAEMRWIPFALGVFILLAARTAVFGRVGNALDLLVLFSYFSVFSLGAFYYRLYTYGHNLSPEAPIKVEPFTPPLIGHHRLANFDVYSYPGPGSVPFALFGTMLAVLLLLDYRAKRSELREAARR